MAKIDGESLAKWATGFADLLESGISLTEALKYLSTSPTRRSLRRFSKASIEGIQRGGTLAESAAKYQSKIGPILSTSIELGEMTGKSPQILRMTAVHLQDMHDTQRRINRLGRQFLFKVFSMFFAPAAIAQIGLEYLLPNGIPGLHTGKFDLLGLGLHGRESVVILGCLLLTTMAASIILLKTWIAISRRNIYLLRILTLLPWVGPIIRLQICQRIAMGFEMICHAGVAPVVGFPLVLRLTAIPAIESRSEVMLSAFGKGGLASALEKIRALPPAFIQDVRIGEASGKLTTAFERLNKRASSDLTEQLKKVEDGVAVIFRFLVTASSFGILARLLYLVIMKNANSIGF